MFRRIRIRAGSANFYTHNTPTAHMEQEGKLPAGCSKSSSSKAAASEGPQAYPLGYVEGLNDARTPLAGFWSILLDRILKDRLRPNRLSQHSTALELLKNPTSGRIKIRWA